LREVKKEERKKGRKKIAGLEEYKKRRSGRRNEDMNRKMK
jgi:hypothetical protein